MPPTAGFAGVWTPATHAELNNDRTAVLMGQMVGVQTRNPNFAGLLGNGAVEVSAFRRPRRCQTPPLHVTLDTRQEESMEQRWARLDKKKAAWTDVKDDAIGSNHALCSSCPREPPSALHAFSAPAPLDAGRSRQGQAELTAR